MFWNDPNLYSVALKDTPTPRSFYNFTPYMNPMPFMPQIPQIPQQFAQFPQFPPQFPQFTPPVTPFFHAQTLPWVDRPMTIPYGYNFPLFQGHRPFGL